MFFDKNKKTEHFYAQSFKNLSLIMFYLALFTFVQSNTIL